VKYSIGINLISSLAPHSCLITKILCKDGCCVWLQWEDEKRKGKKEENERKKKMFPSFMFGNREGRRKRKRKVNLCLVWFVKGKEMERIIYVFYLYAQM
jgi:hypothetical protein